MTRQRAEELQDADKLIAIQTCGAMLDCFRAKLGQYSDGR
jgi:hypothetical protein